MNVTCGKTGTMSRKGRSSVSDFRAISAVPEKCSLEPDEAVDDFVLSIRRAIHPIESVVSMGEFATFQIELGTIRLEVS